MKFDELSKWIFEYNVKELTENGFLKVIDNLRKDSPRKFTRIFGDNYDSKLLTINFYKVAFTVSIELDTNYIASYAEINYNNREMGVYKLIFDEAGNIDDDYWVSRDD